VERIQATEARVHFGQLMRRVCSQGPVLVERAGQPLVVVLSVADYERLGGSRSDQQNLLSQCALLRQQIEQRVGLTPSPVDVIADFREERSSALGLP